VAKDTDKLIRQLSLISFLMAERRHVTALEIKQDVEGYSEMTDEAFARRFYADRAELHLLGIELKVEKAADGFYEAENYSLPPENFYLSPIEFSDAERSGLSTALSLLDGRFAYAEPLRLALQQLAWGRPSPLDAPENSTVRLRFTASAGGRELSQRLSKIETAIFRRKTILFDYYTIGSDTESKRKVDPYHLLFRGGQFYLIGHSHERNALRVFRLSRIRGKVAYSSKAEHDFPPPSDFDPRPYATRAEWQLGEPEGSARIWLSESIDWLVRRHFASAGTVTDAADADDAPGPGSVFETGYSDVRQLVSWVIGLGEQARVLGPPELERAAREAVERVIALHSEPIEIEGARPVAPQVVEPDANGRGEAAIRPERFARLITLAGILVDAGGRGDKLEVKQLCDTVGATEEELREDIDVLNVVNFGGGSYVLYAEVQGDMVEVDPEPYGDSFARPSRFLPLEAKALVAAIDLIGDHLPQGSLQSAREKIVEALGHDPAEAGLQITTAAGDDSEPANVVRRAIAERRLISIDYYKENEAELTPDRRVEPYLVMNGEEGWYVVAFDPEKDGVRHFRLDRIKSAEVLDEGFEPRPGLEHELDSEPAGHARVWISPERARWAREDRQVVEELADGAVIAEIGYRSPSWLAKEILKEGGDAAVLEPEDARDAVLGVAEAVAGAVRR